MQGLQGLQGENGIPAPSGVNGDNGLNGEPGLPGRPGDNGLCAPIHSGWSSDPPTESNGGWSSDEITIEYTPEEEIPPSEAPETSEEVPADPPTTGGWVPEPDLGAAQPDNEWDSSAFPPEPEPAAPQANPLITPAKPAQAAQSSLSQKPHNFGKPNPGNNPYMPAAAVPMRPSPHGPQGPMSSHDKRPEFPGSQSFQGSNPLWGSPQFQSSVPMLQSYGQMGGGYWKNTGTRMVDNKKSTPCTKKGRGKAKRKPPQQQPLSQSTAPTPQVVVSAKVDKEKAAAAPPRARVDLDLLEESEYHSLS